MKVDIINAEITGTMCKTIQPHSLEMVKAELMQLDNENLLLDGKYIKPSNCYYFGSNPLHVLYNTNCPESLKEKIETILEKYSDTNEEQMPTG